jgi:prephenate dehydrogenase
VVWNRVCILGVGLLGGSIGMKLIQSRLAKEVVGYGRDSEKLKQAVVLKAIDTGSTSLREAASGADLVVACTPVQQIPEVLAAAAEVADSQALLTDVGSTKSTLVEQLSKLGLSDQFVGSHPLAGSDRSGVRHATAKLFEDRLVMVTPTKDTKPLRLQQTLDFWQSLSARLHVMSPIEHDEAMAVTSHLPHVVASILAAATPESLVKLTGTGWQDTTRIAAGQPELWRQILEENYLPVLHALQNFATISADWIQAIEAKDFTRVEQLLKSGKLIRDSVGNQHSSG